MEYIRILLSGCLWVSWIERTQSKVTDGEVISSRSGYVKDLHEYTRNTTLPSHNTHGFSSVCLGYNGCIHQLLKQITLACETNYCSNIYSRLMFIKLYWISSDMHPNSETLSFFVSSVSHHSSSKCWGWQGKVTFEKCIPPHTSLFSVWCPCYHQGCVSGVRLRPLGL